MKQWAVLGLWLILAGCARHDERSPVGPTDFPHLAVSQAWDVMQSQGLSALPKQRLRQDRVVAEFDRALGLRSALVFSSRQAFEQAVSGARFEELDRVVSALPGPREAARWNVYGAWVAAIARSFDDSATFYPPSRHDAVDRVVSGAEEGVGVEIKSQDGSAIISAVSPDGPAKSAGVPVGARVLGIKERGMAEIDLSSSSVDDVREILKGPRGSSLVVRVSTRGGVAEYRLSRERWAGRSTRVQVSKAQGLRIVSIPRLYDDAAGSGVSSASDFQAALALLGGEPYVLDLRSNPGGVIDQASVLASLAGASGPLWTIASRRASVPFVAVKTGARLPVAVWVNKDTGSAAEILAGAMQSRGVSVVGLDTAGRSEMQLMVPLDHASFLRKGSSDTGTLLLTTAKIERDGARAGGIRPDCRIAEKVAKPSDKQYANATQTCIASDRG